MNERKPIKTRLRHTKETKAKISASMRGHPVSDATRKRQREARLAYLETVREDPERNDKLTGRIHEERGKYPQPWRYSK
jgi:hypothetical protein